MRFLLPACLLLLMLSPALAQPLPDSLAARLHEAPLHADGSRLRYAPEDEAAAEALLALFGEARAAVEAFFGAPFAAPFTVTVAPDRAAFSAVLREAWGVPETACWMVATGVARFAVVLSPRAWPADACEHDASDAQHVRDLLVHELTHVYHGQLHPSPDFSGAEEPEWFVEGLAVLVAGQLDRGHLADPAEAVAAGQAPTRLADAWTGRWRYGVSGSLVRYVDETYGRAVVRDLLAAPSTPAILDALTLDEPTLLARWRDDLASKGDYSP